MFCMIRHIPSKGLQDLLNFGQHRSDELGSHRKFRKFRGVQKSFVEVCRASFHFAAQRATKVGAELAEPLAETDKVEILDSEMQVVMEGFENFDLLRGFDEFCVVLPRAGFSRQRMQSILA